MTAPCRLPISYVLPLYAKDDLDLTDLWAYLGELCELVDDLIVVDNSCASAFSRHKRDAVPGIRHLAPELSTTNGKVANVVTGLRHARHEIVVIADDDVRWSRANLEHACARSAGNVVVRPQNYFHPVRWHTCVDGARTLLSRLTGGDWPGTLVVRRSVFEHAGGEYRGDVLFENLQLVRTLRAAGAREDIARDLYVERRPPTDAHFWSQQVRQAYDELARPLRMAAFLAVAPAVLFAVGRGRMSELMLAAAAVVAAAEAGRRMWGGHRYFPAVSVGLAPIWLLWRSACAWIAFGRVPSGRRAIPGRPAACRCYPLLTARGRAVFTPTTAASPPHADPPLGVQISAARMGYPVTGARSCAMRRSLVCR